jgi:membrane associated rhomboid family serine protease
LIVSLFAGIFTDALSGAVALLIGATGLIGGAARYAAVLAGRTEREIERATAFGFFLGFGLGTLALVVDSAT